MKRWVAFLLALGCMLSLCACGKEDTSEEKYVTVYLPSEKITDDGYKDTYTYDEYGNEIEYTVFAEGKEIRRYVSTYDENGNLTESIYYAEGKELTRHVYTYDDFENQTEDICYENGVKRSRYIYTYDNNGNRTEEIYFIDGVERDRYTHTYDKKGNLTETILSQKGEAYGRYTYTYDNKNNTRTMHNYSKLGNEYLLTRIQVMTYDNLDRIVEEALYFTSNPNEPNISAPDSRYTYVYEGENLVEYSSYADGLLIARNTYQYNEHGHQIKYTYDYYSDNYIYNRHESTTYEYTYDKNGNIAQRKAYNDDGYDPANSYTCTYVKVEMTRTLAKKLGYI